MVCGFVKRMIAGPHFLRNDGPAERRIGRGILALTAESRLLSSVLSGLPHMAESADGQALESGDKLCRSGAIPNRDFTIEIFPAIDWRYGTRSPERGRVSGAHLLAAQG